MDAGRGSYLCGLVLGVALGVAGTHVALSGRSPNGRLSELRIESGIAFGGEPAPGTGAADLDGGFAPQPSTVHAIATSPAEVAPVQATSVEPPRPLPKVEHAEPLPTESPREDAELRAFIRDELQTLAASEHDIWYETLRGLSREDATEILRIWKLTRGVESGPISPELKQFASLPIEKLVPRPPVVKSESDSEESRTTATRHDEIRRLCRLNLANRSTPGYKSRELMIFEQTDASAAETTEPAASDFLIKVTQGNLTETQRVLDCAIRGPGFFKVKRDDETLLTRCGRFVVDHEGRIALPRSHGSPCPLEPAITVPENCERLRIDVIGKVTAVVNGETQSLGSIALFNVFDPTAIQPAGDNLFKATPASGFATPLPAMEVDAIIQGSLEESNVDAAVECRKLDALTDSPL